MKEKQIKAFVPFPQSKDTDIQEYLKRLRFGNDTLSYLQKENLPFAITPEISPDMPSWLVACVRASAYFGMFSFVRVCRHNFENPEIQNKLDIISTALTKEMEEITLNELKGVEGSIDQELISKYEPFIQTTEQNNTMEALINNGEVDKITPENFPILRATGNKTRKIMLIIGLMNRRKRLEEIVGGVITKLNELGFDKEWETRKSWVEEELESVNKWLKELIYEGRLDKQKL